MGRAIDMEKDIDMLKREVQLMKDILQEILDEVKEEEIVDEKEIKKTNTKRSKTSGGKSDTRHDDSKSEG